MLWFPLIIIFFTLFHCFNSSFKTCKLSTKVKPLVQKITFLVNVSIKEQTKQNKRRKAYAIKSSGLHFQPTLVVHRTSISYKSLDSTARGIERFSRFLRTSQLYLSRCKTRKCRFSFNHKFKSASWLTNFGNIKNRCGRKNFYSWLPTYNENNVFFSLQTLFVRINFVVKVSNVLL